MRSHEKGGGVPKVVDHDARRREIADAVLRLVVREGVEAVSLRKVAAESGMAMGTTQHYFTDREEMLTFALATMNERRSARVQAAVAALGERPDERRLLRTIITEVLPLTEESRFEAAVGAAYYIRALGDPETRALLSAGPRQVIDLLRGLLTGAAARGRLAAGVDPAQEARFIWALLEPAPVMGGYWDAEEAVAMADYQLDRIFTAAD
ncbi:TetR family transcriptional regulator [Enemella evansiae]|uniref:TetR family transcriptional regulator n=1 Tax=Enemella evansiae TaxID=2016499 RepID=A0A255G153_9ACTN|nr:TetR family transcriptional regulator [Enemella evansiae]